MGVARKKNKKRWQVRELTPHIGQPPDPQRLSAFKADFKPSPTGLAVSNVSRVWKPDEILALVFEIVRQKHSFLFQQAECTKVSPILNIAKV